LRTTSSARDDHFDLHRHADLHRLLAQVGQLGGDHRAFIQLDERNYGWVAFNRTSLIEFSNTFYQFFDNK
jgi:hypothetical protein